MTKFLKRFLAVILTAAMLVGCGTTGTENQTTASDTSAAVQETTAPQEEKGIFTAGTYTAVGKGNNGDIVLSVTFSEDAIIDIKVDEHSETSGLSDPAFEKLPAAVLKNQSLAVDVISGATNSSKGILAAIEDCVKQAGANPEELKGAVESESQVVKDASCDIVIVGGGAAGMTAAINATEAGANVILVEKLGTLGGGDTSRISSYFRVAGSQVQVQQGIEDADEADDYYNKILSETPNINPDVLRILADEGGAVADWLISLGVDLTGITKTDTTRLKLSDGGAPGPEIIKALWGELDRLNVDYRLNTKAIDIIMEDGVAKGVIVETKDGNYNINASAVIMAAGGYANSAELISQYAPEWVGRPSTGSPALTGDGQKMAERAGAKIISMDVIKSNPVCLETEDGNFSLVGILPYSILVNHSGARFVNEELSSSTKKADAVMQQEDKEAYILFDQSAVDEIANVQKYVERGYFMQANTMEEVAALINVDEATFLANIAAYQEAFDAGSADEFGRTPAYRVDVAPYYVARVTASIQNTSGGMAVDAYGRALDVNNEVIPGLYGAGHGVAHCGDGNTLNAGMASLAVIYGKVSAETAVADIQK